MRASYELTAQDVEDAMLVLTVRRRERIRAFQNRVLRGPLHRHLLINAAFGAMAGALLLPFGRAYGLGLAVIASCVIVAVPIAT